MVSRFDFYERVRIASSDPAKATIDGHLGAILGKSQAEDGSWWYGVFVYELERVWHCSEAELVSTGEFDTRETLYSGESLRVNRCGDVLE